MHPHTPYCSKTVTSQVTCSGTEQTQVTGSKGTLLSFRALLKTSKHSPAFPEIYAPHVVLETEVPSIQSSTYLVS